MCLSKTVYVIATTVIAAFILSTITVAAERENGSEECTLGSEFIEHSMCHYNNTGCDIPFFIGNCLSCEPSTCEVVEGTCFLDLDVNSSLTADLKSGMIYSKLPPPKSCEELTDRMCGGMNREGSFCSQCKPGYGPTPYSNDFKCFKCSNDSSTRQWLLYLALELVPSTAFYFVVILFNVRTTAPPYTAFVFFSQFFAFIYKVHPYIRLKLILQVNKVLLHGILTLTSFWNLDFFNHLVPPFCISSSLTDLHVLLLELISAFYPLSLVILTLVCIELHARNFRPLVILWKPVHRYFANCRRKLDPKSSVIAAFATFVSLSFSKILATVLLAIFPGTYFFISRSGEQVRGLYDPSIQGNTTAEYWKQLVTTPYFIPLLIVFIIVQLPALLLLLYPIKAFRRLLTCCGSSRYHTVYVFIDTFQGHYKDGTNGSRDYRAASSISFLLKILIFFNLSNGHIRHGIPTHSLSIMSYAYILVIISLFYGIIQPCKKKYMNVIESVVYCAAGLILLSLGIPTFNSLHFHDFRQGTGNYIDLYVSLIFLALPSLMLLITFVAKIFTCLGCIHGNKFI